MISETYLNFVVENDDDRCHNSERLKNQPLILIINIHSNSRKGQKLHTIFSPTRKQDTAICSDTSFQHEY